MRVLALDSSGIVASVAVVEDDTLVAEYTVNYGGAQWGKPDNYDLCINSASYGINETENLILKLLNDQIH